MDTQEDTTIAFGTTIIEEGFDAGEIVEDISLMEILLRRLGAEYDSISLLRFEGSGSNVLVNCIEYDGLLHLITKKEDKVCAYKTFPEEMFIGRFYPGIYRVEDNEFKSQDLFAVELKVQPSVIEYVLEEASKNLLTYVEDTMNPEPMSKVLSNMLNSLGEESGSKFVGEHPAEKILIYPGGGIYHKNPQIRDQVLLGQGYLSKILEIERVAEEDLEDNLYDL
jgi:hypothetical protein